MKPTPRHVLHINLRKCFVDGRNAGLTEAARIASLYGAKQSSPHIFIHAFKIATAIRALKEPRG